MLYLLTVLILVLNQAIKWLNSTLDRQGLFEEWLAFSKERLEIIQREGWSVSVEACRALDDLGRVYAKLGRLSEATHAHEKQVDTARKLGNRLKEEGLVFEADGLFHSARAAAALTPGGCCIFKTGDNYKRAIDVLSQCKTSGRKQYILSTYYFQLGLHHSNVIQITQRYKFRMQKETGCTGVEENVFPGLSAEERALSVKGYAGGRVSGLDAAGAPTVTVSLRENLQGLSVFAAVCVSA
jgi:tetratricopeptide (TPR) repeat protein